MYTYILVGISIFSLYPAITGIEKVIPGKVPFDAPPLAEDGVGGRSFADDTLCCRVERAWRVRAAAAGRASGGARESRCFAGHYKIEVVLKIQNDITSISVRVYTWYQLVRKFLSCMLFSMAY